MGPQERQRRLDFIIKFCYYALLCLLIYVAFEYALDMVLPFALAFGVALLLKPVVDAMQKKWKMPRAAGTLLMMLLFYGLMGLLLILLGVRLSLLLRDLVLQLPSLYSDYISPAIQNLFGWLERLVSRFDAQGNINLTETAAAVSESLGTVVRNLSVKALSVLTRGVSLVPGLLLRILFTVIATFHFTMDYKILTGFVLRQLPERWGTILHEVRTGLGRTVGQYIRSYFLIMLITAVELSVGFALIGIKDPILTGLLVSVFDILPVVGSGTVLIPWAVICLFQGAYMRALWLTVLCAAITVVRNILEPKIVGDTVGLHPVVALMAMFVGAYLFGGIGLLGLPITLALLNSMQNSGVISIFKK